MKKYLGVGFLVACVLLVGVGAAVGSLLIERSLTASVTIASQADLYILSSDGKPLTTLDFGTLVNGAHLTQSVTLWNSGNVPYAITIMRTDTVSAISSVCKRQDGTLYDNNAPIILGLGETLILNIEIWNTASLQAGSYPLSFKVTGS